MVLVVGRTVDVTSPTIVFPGLFTGRVKSRGSGPTRPVRISRRLNPTRPDPTREISNPPDPTKSSWPDPRDFEILLTRPDPTQSGLPARCGFHAGQVDLTRDTSHGSKSKSRGSKHIYLGRLVGPWSLVLFPGCCARWFLYRHCLQHYYVVCARKTRKRDRNPCMGN